MKGHMKDTDSMDETEYETAIEIANAVSRRMVSAREMVDRALERGVGQVRGSDPLATRRVGETIDRVDPDLGDCFRVLLGDRLDLDTALLGQHAEMFLGPTVERKAGVVLLRNIAGHLDPHALNNVTLNVESENVAGVLAHGIDIGGELDTPSFASATSMNLGLNHDGRSQTFGRSYGLVDGERYLAVRYGHPVLGEELLALILEQIHVDYSLSLEFGRNCDARLRRNSTQRY